MNKKFGAVIAAVVAIVLGICFAVSSFGFVKDGYGDDQMCALAEMGLIEYREAEYSVTRGEAIYTIMVATRNNGEIYSYDPESTACPYIDMSYDLAPYIATAYEYGIVGDMPYDMFREDDNISLYDMLDMTLRACGLLSDSESDVYAVAEENKIYKICEADTFVFDLTYAAYAEILWNVVCTTSSVNENKTYGELLVDDGLVSPEAYSSAMSLMSGYVFGQKHEYVTKAFSWSEVFDYTETTTRPVETTARPAETTKPPLTEEDNEGYSPPFRPAPAPTVE